MELEEVQKWKDKAKEMLDKARENASKRDVKPEIEYFVVCMTKIGLKPKDIDTNMREILDLLKQGFFSSMQFWVGRGCKSEDEHQTRLCQKYFRIYNRNLNTARHMTPIDNGGWDIHIDRRFVDL